ncbi:MAG: hypothetical protein IIX86_02590 [Clostridia bacterium]|nr:hypothetical protein [Clostridia bacterium]
MLQEQVKEYVSLGSAFKEDEKLYRTQCFVPLVFALIGGMAPGAILGGFWPFLLIVMLIVSVACVITTFKLSSYGLTLQDALCLDAFIYGTWVLNLSILELMYFVMWKGFTPWLLLMYLPVICIPLFVGMRIHILLKKKKYSKKKNREKQRNGCGFWRRYGRHELCGNFSKRGAKHGDRGRVGVFCYSEQLDVAGAFVLA